MNHKFIWRLLATVANVVGLIGCANSVDEAGLQAYLQNADHGLVQQLTTEAGTAICSYRPTDALVAQELRASSLPATPAILDSLRRTYRGRSYFTLALSQNGSEIENQLVNDRTAFGQAIAYLNTTIAQDVFLAIPDQDSVAALASAYTRQYGNTGRSTILLVFDTRQQPLDRDFYVTFRDRYFGLGTLRFVFRAADIADLPALKP